MELREITHKCPITRDSSRKGSAEGTVKVQLPRALGAHTFFDYTAQIAVFEDEHSGDVYLAMQSLVGKNLTLRVQNTASQLSMTVYGLNGFMYERALSDQEQDEGLSPERWQAMIWMLSQVAKNRHYNGREIA